MGCTSSNDLPKRGCRKSFVSLCPNSLITPITQNRWLKVVKIHEPINPSKPGRCRCRSLKSTITVEFNPHFSCEPIFCEHPVINWRANRPPREPRFKPNRSQIPIPNFDFVAICHNIPQRKYSLPNPGTFGRDCVGLYWFVFNQVGLYPFFPRGTVGFVNQSPKNLPNESSIPLLTLLNP